MVGRKPTDDESPAALELPPELREGLDLARGSAKLLIQHPEQLRSSHGAGPLPGRDRQLADLPQPEPKRLGPLDELQPVEVGFSVEESQAIFPP